VLELPGQRAAAAREAARAKRKMAEGKEDKALDPAEAKKRAEQKLKEELARLEARKKRREERRATKRADREKARASAAARRAARRGSVGSVEETPADEEDEEDEEDDDDDDSDTETKPAGGAGSGGAGGGGGGGGGAAGGAGAEGGEGSGGAGEAEAVANDKVVCAVALSCDGTLLVAGCTERLLSVVDAARPSAGPLAQFLALGEVTAVAVGPGLLPWRDTALESSQDKAGTRELVSHPSFMSLEGASGSSSAGTPMADGDDDGSDEEEWEEGGGGGGGSVARTPTAASGGGETPGGGRRQTAADAEFEALRFHASPMGDGAGHLGVIMAGDSTGAVFILRMTDVLRCAEAERQRKAIEQENKRRADAEAKKRHEEELKRAAEEERKRQESLKAAARPPVETLEFPSGVVATAVLPPRQMTSDQPADRTLALDILKIFGIKYDLLVADALESHDADLLLHAMDLADKPRPGTSPGLSIITPAPAPPPASAAAAAAASAAPAGPGTPTAAGGRQSRATMQPRGGGRGGGRAARASLTAVAAGGGGGEGGGGGAAAAAAAAAAAVPPPAPADVEAAERGARVAALREEFWERPRCLVGVFGGAGGLHDLLVPNLRRLVKRGAVAAAVMCGGMVLDGGTAAGVMDMIGTAVAGAEHNALRLMGVSPAQLVLKPGDKSSDPNSSPLEPHHANFVLVPSNEWGGETSTMFTMAAVLAERIPAVAMLANGGLISKREVVNAVRHAIPVVVIEGSGRLADQIARAVHRRDETPPDEYDPTIYIPDDEVREIVMGGDIHLFSVTGQAETLRNVLVDILALQRDRIALRAAEAEAAAAAAAIAPAAGSETRSRTNSSAGVLTPTGPSPLLPAAVGRAAVAAGGAGAGAGSGSSTPGVH